MRSQLSHEAWHVLAPPAASLRDQPNLPLRTTRPVTPSLSATPISGAEPPFVRDLDASRRPDTSRRTSPHHREHRPGVTVGPIRLVISIWSDGLSIHPEKTRNSTGQEARSMSSARRLTATWVCRSRGSCRQHADAAGQIRSLNADPQAAIIPEPDPRHPRVARHLNTYARHPSSPGQAHRRPTR
jgi:hypothetical protein